MRHQGQGRLEIPLSRSRQAAKDRRLSVDGKARHGPGEALFQQGHGREWRSRKLAMDKSGANKVAIDAINAGRDVAIVVRQVKYLNDIVEQDHRAIKRVTRPMLNFKSFRCAGSVLAGVELMHMIRKGQFVIDGTDARCRSSTNFMRWQGRSVQFEGRSSFSGLFRLFDQQRDRTIAIAMPQSVRISVPTPPSLPRRERR
jgi:hypothetical protein